jgi:hypothetical protein
MRQVLPFLLFAFFFAVIWFRRTRDAPPPGVPRQPGLRGIVLGNPPVNSGADAFARFGFYLAWAIGLVAIVGEILELLLPAGALIVVAGVIMTLNTSGARDQFAERARRGVAHRKFGSAVIIGPMFGVLMTVVGLGWFAGGVAALLR